MERERKRERVRENRGVSGGDAFLRCSRAPVTAAAETGACLSSGGTEGTTSALLTWLRLVTLDHTLT